LIRRRAGEGADIVRTLTILGLDPGLAALGWGVLRAHGNTLTFVACGTIATIASDALPLRLKALHDGLAEVMAGHRPDAAAVEETFVNADPRGAVKLAQARAIALLAPALAGVPVKEYTPNLVKKCVVGTGHAGKAQIRRMVALLLPGSEAPSEHAADALAVAIAHAHLGATARRIAESVR
jgi:crossover junction endodeoxyribonuclease RuvC